MLHVGKSGLQTRHQAQQHGHDAGMTGSITRSQTRRQQTSGVALEDQHGVIHVLVVGTVEEAKLLLAMRGIVGGIDIEQDLTALADLLATEADELIEQGCRFKRTRLRAEGAFSQRLRVGCEPSAFPQGLIRDESERPDRAASDPHR